MTAHVFMALKGMQFVINTNLTCDVGLFMANVF